MFSAFNYYLQALADAPASMAAEHQLSMSKETVCLEANPDAESWRDIDMGHT